MKFIALLLLAACAAPLPKPDEPGAADTYRREIAADKAGKRAVVARERLEEAEVDEARRTHTIFAYRHFLQEHPDSRYTPEIRQRLDGLRWAEVERDGSEASLAAYLAEDPRAAHAQDAWRLLSALQLDKALRDGSAPALHGWLATHPDAAGREKAVAALDDADFRAATSPAAWRQYLDEHLDGAHRGEAQAKLDAAAREEALLLGDEQKLRALDPAAARKEALAIALAKADAAALSELHAVEALKDLQKHPALREEALKLFLPRETIDELPDAPEGRIRRLQQWAAALDGRRLPRIAAEIAAPRASVALAALEALQRLSAGLPAAETRARAERVISALQPIAMAGRQLAELSALKLAAGDKEGALEAARIAATRDSRCAPAVWLASQLETDPALKPVAAQLVRAQAVSLADAHAQPARDGDRSAALELCAARRAAERAAALLPDAAGDAASVAHRAEEAERLTGKCAAADPAEAWAVERRAAAHALAVAGGPVAKAALARAAVRDPDPEVRAQANGARASLH